MLKPQLTKIIVHFYIDFTFRFKQIWLFPYPYGFCNPVRIHRMKINMIWYFSRTCCQNCSDTSNIWATDNFRGSHYTVLKRSPNNRCLSDRKFYRWLYTIWQQNRTFVISFGMWVQNKMQRCSLFSVCRWKNRET
jgi:hypothetical protein